MFYLLFSIASCILVIDYDDLYSLGPISLFILPMFF